MPMLQMSRRARGHERRVEEPTVALGVVVTTGEPCRFKRGNRILRDGVAGVEVVAGVIVTVDKEESDVVEGGIWR